MQLPNEKTKKFEEIASGQITTSQTVDIDIDVSKYDKIIIDIDTGSHEMNEGASGIIELDDNGAAINKGVNLYNYVNTSYNCNVFFYKYDGNTFKLNCRSCTGWPQRNYWIRGILK